MEARRLDCPQCGAAPPWDGRSEAASCEHCGASFPLPGPLFRELRAHEGAVDASLDQATDARAAAMWTAKTHKAAAQTSVLGSLFQLALLLAGLTLVCCILILAISLSEIGGGLLLLLTIAALVAAGIFRRRQLLALRARQRPVLREHGQRCPRCGGPGELLSERTSSRCGWCGHEWIAAAEALGHHREEAQEHAREARLRQLHAARLYEARFHRSPNADLPKGLLFTALLAAVVGPALVGIGIHQVLVRGAPPKLAITLISAVTILFVFLAGAFFLFLRRRRRQRAALRESFDGLARVLGGRSGDDPSVVAEWLNAHWPAEQPWGAVRLGPRYGWAIGERAGVPIAVVANLHDGTGSHLPVELGAWLFLAEASESSPASSPPRIMGIETQQLNRWSKEPKEVEEEVLSILRGAGLL